jgi:HlyD family secretion protein
MAKSKSYGGLITLFVVIAAAAGGTWYYVKGKAQKQPEFITIKIARGDIIQAVTATGDLQPVVTVDIGAQVSGQIKEVLVDFNSIVKAGDVLARIDESTPTQRLKQARADLESASASNKLVQLNVARTRELFEKKLVSQQELDGADAQLAQSNANLLQRRASVENAEIDLQRCTIVAPIDGMVLDRKTDKGRTVNASMNAPTLFTLVNDLSRMQINAAVAEADIGLIHEGQPVRFTVDAFPGRTFSGTVRQVRNAASANQNVVSYATIIDVTNDDLRLKPGMTANVSIVVSERPDVLRVANQALRLRVPQDLQPKPPAAPASPAAPAKDAAGKEATGSDSGTVAAANLTDDERRRAIFEIMREIGFQRGQGAPSPDVIEKAKKLAIEKGLDPDLVAASFAMPAGRGRGTGGGGSTGGRGSTGRGGGTGGDRGFNNTIIERTVYKLADPDAPRKELVAVRARLGISDGINTEVLEGLNEGDIVVTGITIPGATAMMQAGGSMQNPFSGGHTSSRSGFTGGSSSSMRSR